MSEEWKDESMDVWMSGWVVNESGGGRMAGLQIVP